MTNDVRQRYSEEDKERGLQALALWQGDRKRASKALVEAGFRKIPPTTLQRWKDTESYRYEQARRAVQERVWAETGEEWQALQRKAIEAASKLVTKASELTDAGDINEAAKAARAAQSLGVTGGISTDKTGVSQQRPAVHEHSGKDVAELVASLADRFPSVFPGLKESPLYVDSTATEVPETQAEIAATDAKPAQAAGPQTGSHGSESGEDDPE